MKNKRNTPPVFRRGQFSHNWPFGPRRIVELLIAALRFFVRIFWQVQPRITEVLSPPNGRLSTAIRPLVVSQRKLGRLVFRNSPREVLSSRASSRYYLCSLVLLLRHGRVGM